jgi:hypothetical protein
MNLPGMVGEASVYKTNNHYGGAAGGSFANNGNMAVTAQGCGFTDVLTCAVFVAGAVTVCGAFCVACVAAIPTGVGAIPLCSAAAACVFGVGALGTYEACHDCLPDFITDAVDFSLTHGGGGGGGGTPPPPPPVFCNGVRCPPGNVCCGCGPVDRCLPRGLCERLCRAETSMSV